MPPGGWGCGLPMSTARMADPAEALLAAARDVARVRDSCADPRPPRTGSLTRATTAPGRRAEGGTSVVETELWNMPAPNVPVALATAAQAAGSKRSMLPIGASAIGMVSLRPRKVVLVSVELTLRSTRGRNASESSASRFLRTVVSVSAPPMM